MQEAGPLAQRAGPPAQGAGPPAQGAGPPAQGVGPPAQGAGPPATPIPQLDGGYDPDHKAEQLRDTMRRLEAAETATANNYKAIYGAFLIL